MDNKYSLDYRLGTTSDVYRGIKRKVELQRVYTNLYYVVGTNIVSGEAIAIKLERLEAENPYLENEARIHGSLAGGIGIPWVRWFGIEGNYNVMVLDLLGPSLEDLFNYCNRKFSLKTVLLIADQLISRIEYIHAKFFIYRGVKPDSFLMGTGKMSAQINVIGFGFAKEYGDSKVHSQNPQHGTAHCASVKTQSGFGKLSSDHSTRRTKF